MRNAFDGVTLPVCEVVHRVNTPLVARAVVMGVFDAVHDGVAQVHVGGTHVAFGTQYPSAIGEFPVFHAFKQVQVFSNAALAVGTFGARCRRIAFLRFDFFLGRIVHVGQALFDQFHGKIVELRKIIRSKTLIVPFGTQPTHIGPDAVHVFHFFGYGIGVVKTQIELALVTLGNAIIDGDGLGVANMQIAIGLWRETGVNPASVFAIGNVFFNDLLNKIE